jgi:hypothetical protein
MEKETEIIADNIKKFIYASTLNLTKVEAVDLLADLASWNVDFMLMITKGFLDLATGEDKK